MMRIRVLVEVGHLNSPSKTLMCSNKLSVARQEKRVETFGNILTTYMCFTSTSLECTTFSASITNRFSNNLQVLNLKNICELRIIEFNSSNYPLPMFFKNQKIQRYALVGLSMFLISISNISLISPVHAAPTSNEKNSVSVVVTERIPGA